jgi:hypothetical protein
VLLRVLVVLVAVLLIALNVDIVRRARRGDREYLRRLAAQPAYGGGGWLMFVRRIVPVSLLMSWLFACFGLAALLGSGESVVPVGGGLLGIVVLGINLLVVRLTGWPAFQIPAPFRGMSEAELQSWFDADSTPGSGVSIADHLPLDVVDASFDSSVLVVRGQDWYLAAWSPWRGEIEGCQVDRDDAGTRDLVPLLSGQQLVAVHGRGPRRGVTVFELTRGRIEVDSDPRGRPWQLRLPERTVVVGAARA